MYVNSTRAGSFICLFLCLFSRVLLREAVVLRGEGGDFVPPHPLGHLAMSGDTDDCHNQGRKISELGGGGKDAAKPAPP